MTNFDIFLRDPDCASFAEPAAAVKLNKAQMLFENLMQQYYG